MTLLSVKIVEFIDDGYPGWVRAIFKDAGGKEWSMIDKTVYFESSTPLDWNTTYPQSGGIECKIIGERIDPENRKVLTIDIGTIYGLNAETGETKFDVYSDQIEERLSN